MLLKLINGVGYQQELDGFLKIFRDHIDPFALSLELSIISTIFKDGKQTYCDVLPVLKGLSTNERLLVKNGLPLSKSC